MATRSKKPTSKPKKATRGKAPATEQPDDVLAGYDDKGRPQWEPGPEEGSLSGEPSDDDEVPFPSGDSDAWDDDVPVVTAEDLDEAEQSLAEKDAATTSAPLRMHPIVASIVESDPDRYQPMDDYDDERPRCESLPVKLTEEELHSLGDEISELVEKLRRTEEENKQIRKQLGQAEAMLKNEIHGKNAVKRDGKEMRKVPVQSVGNLKSNRRETYRLDTGERVDALSRALSFSEIQDLSQMGLPGIPTSRGGRKA
jgi:hypothetical protein